MNTCIVCGKEYKDTHPGRNTPKEKQTCCRACYLVRLKRDGHWNTGLKWKDMYLPETLEKMEKRINTKGKGHWNTDRKRYDLLLRNLINNPNKTTEEKEEIKKMLKNAPIETINNLLEKMTQRKRALYQEKAWAKYGKKCVICGRTDGQIDVHHKDGNHDNNKLSNLMVLCPKHHREFHKKQ